MKGRTFIAGCALALALLVFAQRHQDAVQPLEFRGVVDLSHSLEFPTNSGKDGNFARAGTLPGHFETQLDAPAEFSRGLWTVDQIPAERLLAPLVVLDVTAETRANPDYQVSLEDIAKWERINGTLPLNSVVITHTGWDARWSSVRDYRNADAKGVMHFPGYSEDAAKFLVEARNTLGLGIDTLSIDYGPSQDFPVHRYTQAHSLYQLENVANLDHAPSRGGIVMVAPAKLEGGLDAPVRILALVR
ncbi:MAG: cyclase family protein [Terriglobales bacterium]